MRIFDIGAASGRLITEFDSHAAHALEIAKGSGEAHAFLIRFDRGGIIGPHPAGFGQLFAPLHGAGWIAGADGTRHRLQPGQAALLDRGELHSKGSDEGMTAVMVQIHDLTPVVVA